jgi:phosphoribosylaminoimidazole-succinocarboxamide synthase
LTKISLFWFEKLRDIVPNHVLTANVDDMPEEVQRHRDVLSGRTMLVKKARVIPLEAIVRGYITGDVSFISSPGSGSQLLAMLIQDLRGQSTRNRELSTAFHCLQD